MSEILKNPMSDVPRKSSNIMDKKELIKKLRALPKKYRDKRDSVQPSYDNEKVHIEADKLLIEYINDDDVKKAFEGLEKWYS